MDATYIRLDHFLKRENVVGSGGQAKLAIQGGIVHVNGEVEKRRGRKLVAGDVVRFEGEQLVVALGEPDDNISEG
jgi:ribosome-associated protein